MNRGSGVRELIRGDLKTLNRAMKVIALIMARVVLGMLVVILVVVLCRG